MWRLWRCFCTSVYGVLHPAHSLSRARLAPLLETSGFGGTIIKTIRTEGNVCRSNCHRSYGSRPRHQRTTLWSMIICRQHTECSRSNTRDSRRGAAWDVRAAQCWASLSSVQAESLWVGGIRIDVP